MPLVTGEAGGGGGVGGVGGGTRREDGECGGLGPSRMGRSPPSRPQAQGGAQRLKPRREWDGLQPASGSGIGFGGRRGTGKVWALEGDLGLGRKAGLAMGLKPGPRVW